MIAVMFDENEKPDEARENNTGPILEEVTPVSVTQNSEPVSVPVTQVVTEQPFAPTPVVEAPVLATSYIEPAPRRSHKGLIISLVAVFVLLFAGVGGFAGWYFGIRMPDTEYEKSLAYLDSMIADAAAMKKDDSSLKSNPSVTTTVTSARLTADESDKYQASLGRLSDAQDKAAEYLGNQKLLQDSLVVTKDPSVKVIYDANKKVINEYGQTSDPYYRTGYIFYTMMMHCSDLSDLADVKSVSEYDLKAKPCKDYMIAHETVPSKVFSDSLYVPYRKVMLNLVQLLHDYFGSKTQAQQAATEQKILALYQELAKIDTSKMDSAKNSQNPASQLKAVRDKVVERKAVFFR